MSSISQRIPTFLGGISQQADILKRPGQVVDAVNILPDYALGTLKRPGGKFEAELMDASTSGKWFSILRDQNEKYVAQYDDSAGQNRFKIWSLLDGGRPMPVDMGPNHNVPATCNITTLKTDLDAMKVADRDVQTKKADVLAKEALYAQAYAGQSITKTTRLEVRNDYKNGYYVPVVDTGIVEDTNTGTTLIMEDTVIVASITTGSAYPANYIKGTDRTFDYPLLRRDGKRIYELQKSVAATHTLAELQTAEANLNTATAAYNTAVTAFNTAKATYDTQFANCAVPALTGDYMEITTAGSGFTDGTYTGVGQAAASTSGVTGATFDITVSGGAITAATINTDPGTFKGNDQVTLTGYSGAVLTYKRGSYLAGATADDIELLTLNDYTFVLNKNQKTAMLADKSPANANEGFVVIGIVAFSATYNVIVNGSTASYTTSAATSSAPVDTGVIVSGLISAINGLGVGVTATAVGPGIHISHPTSLSLSTSGSGAEEGLYSFQNQISAATKLPGQCKNGFIVKVVNNSSITIDDQYVKFETENGTGYGQGVWIETVGPELEFKLDPYTMPQQLVRQANGVFRMDPVDWTDRLVGDDETNPVPSFIGFPISNIFFHRNRFGCVSRDTVFLGRAGDFFNFFGTSGAQVVNDDPIDLTAITQQPVNLHHVQETSIGLVLFAENEQFLLTTAADLLSPTAVKLNTLSKYECDPSVPPVNMGPTLAFVSKTPLWTRLFEITDIRDDMPPKFFETSSYVSELVPSDVDSLIASPALSLVSFGCVGKNTLYQYRFYQTNQERLSSWYKWTLSGNLLHQFFDVSNMFLITSTDANTVHVESIDLTQEREEGFLTLRSGEKTDTCLDLFTVNPRREYDALNNKTKIYLPYHHNPTNGFRMALVNIGTYIGSAVTAASAQTVGSVEYPTVDTSGTDHFIETRGDQRGRNLIVGYVYDMEITMPKFFVGQTDGSTYRTDTTAELILHRFKVDVTLSGPVTYSVAIQGRDTYREEVNVTLPAQYLLNSVNMTSAATHEIPVYQRNKNVTFKIIGDTPFPVSLMGMSWEGKYVQRNYQRMN